MLWILKDLHRLARISIRLLSIAKDCQEGAEGLPGVQPFGSYIMQDKIPLQDFLLYRIFSHDPPSTFFQINYLKVGNGTVLEILLQISVALY